MPSGNATFLRTPVAHHRHLLAKALTARGVVAIEDRVLHRPVAARHAQHQPAIAQVVDRGGRLQREHRFAQRQHHGGSAEQYVLGHARQIAQVAEHLEHLRGIAEGRVVQRHVACPQRAKAQPVGQLRETGVLRDVGHAEGPACGAARGVARRRPVVVQRQLEPDARAAAVGGDQSLKRSGHDAATSRSVPAMRTNSWPAVV
jgi:hypothetical protein